MISDVMMQSFLTLAETLNFTNAAKELYLSQQAVSKHISKLEDALECQLLIRDRGNIRLTPAGEIYKNIFSNYMQEMQNAANLISGMSSNGRKVIRIGYLDLLDISPYLQPILEIIKTRHPNLQVEFHSSPDWELPLLAKEGKVDLIITFDAEVTDLSRFHTVKIGEANEVMIVAKDHILTSSAKGYRDFINESVFFSLPPSGNVNVLLNRMDNYNFPYENLIVTDNLLSSITAIEMGQGVTFLVVPCKLINNEDFATFPTEISVGITLACMMNQTNALAQEFMEVAYRINEGIYD